MSERDGRQPKGPQDEPPDVPDTGIPPADRPGDEPMPAPFAEPADRTTPAPIDPSLVTAADPSELSPIEAALMDACNEMHDARAAGDAERIAELRAQLDSLLARYEATGGEDHPNAAWAVPNQRALALSAAGEVAEAIEAELEALAHADNARRREISLGNLAERCVRVGRIDEALAYFLDAAEAAPHSVPVLVAGAQSMYLAGYRTEANRVFAELLDQAGVKPAMLGPAGELGAYLRYEARLRRMAPDLPALSELFERFDARTGG